MSPQPQAAPSAAETAGGPPDVRRQLVAALVVGAVLLAVMVGGAVWLTGVTRTNTFEVQHTYQVEAAISDLQTEVEKLENARRGYLLAPTAIPLGVANEAAERIVAMQQRLAMLTSDNPQQQARLEQLRPLIALKLARVHSTVMRARAGDIRGATDEYIQSNDPPLMVALRNVLNAMRREEAHLLDLRLGDERASAAALLTAVIAIAVLMVGVGAVGVMLFLRYARDLDRSQSSLRALNAGLESAVRARTADLQRANEEIQRFAYIVSHDLRSPLVNVMGFTSELEVSLEQLKKQLARTGDAEGVSPETRTAIEQDIPESIGFIRSSTKKMDRLINAILQLSRQGRRTLTPEPLDMDALAKGVVDSLETLARDKGAAVATEGRLPGLVSDRVAVEQVLSNLVENALKYLQPGRPGRVAVRGVGADGGRITYEVEDNGRGIDPRDHERVFELFRRSGAQDTPGEGIGLAHVRALVYRLGGTIGCTSELGRGSVFRVNLPAVLTQGEGTLPG